MSYVWTQSPQAPAGASELVLHGQRTPTLSELMEQFRSSTGFSRQLEGARQIATLGNTRAISELEPWLVREDRHARGNAAFVLASLGDSRGFATIRTILTDRSDRPMGQGIPTAPGNATPKWWIPGQIRADRYYAVHLFGLLRNSRAVDTLLPFLGDKEINYHVAWALGEIGDRRAIRPLVAALKDPDAHMRVSAIQALEKLSAAEALPQLQTLLNDQALPSAGPRVPVAETAKTAIARIQTAPSRPAVLIRIRQVGPVAIGASAQSIYDAFRGRVRLKDLALEGQLSPALELSFPETGLAGGVVAELIPRDNALVVWRIAVTNPKVRTEKAIGVGSTVAQLRAAHRITGVGTGEGQFVMVADLGASFELDTSGPGGYRLWEIRDPTKVPGDVKIIKVLVLR